MIRLTDEELDKLWLEDSRDWGKNVSKAQLKKVVEWVIELNDFDEDEDNSPGAYYIISKNLLQAVLEEIKE